jgi:hypothetical protein
LRKLKAQAKGKTKMIDEETLEAAKKQASEAQKAQVIHHIPKTAAGFEKDFNAVKKDIPALCEYLKGIPTTTLESYFKKTEVSFELL